MLRKKLQTVQNNAVRWICNDRYPNRQPIDIRHEELKLEYIADRLKRMAESIWSKIEDENSNFFETTITTHLLRPHKSYPSSYDKTFE